jgi:hypothetical protein
MLRRVWGAAALTALTCAAIGQADPPKPTTTGPYYGKPAWLKRMQSVEPAAPPTTTQSKPRSPEVEAQSERLAAEATLTRRQAVCDRLREIAIASNDEAMLRMLERFEQEMLELYKKSTAHLPCNRLLPDEEKLDRRLDATTPALADRLTDSAKPVNRTSSVSNVRGGGK